MKADGNALLQLWLEQVAAEPQAVAISAEGRSIGRDALQALAERFSDLMRDAPPGAVALHIRDEVMLLAAFLGAMITGRPALPLDVHEDLKVNEPAIEAAQPAIILTDSGDSIARPFTNVSIVAGHTVRLGVCEAALPTGEGEFYWGLSSGSTGAPKVFARAGRSWVESFKACEAVFPFRAGEAVAIPGSLGSSLFLYGAIHALLRGLPLVFGERRNLPASLAAFASAKASVLYAVPTMLVQMAKSRFGAFRPRMIFCGGAKLDAALREHVSSMLPGCDIIEFYGASELSFVTYSSTSCPAPDGSVGRAFPGVEIAIRDDEGDCLPESETGLVTVQSPMVFRRYVTEVAQPSPVLPDGWSTAGDMGRLDGAGFLFLAGRRSRIINTRAYKIAPEKIEAVLAALPGVAEAAVIGLPDAVRGERVVAVLQPRSMDQLPSRTLILAECRGQLGAKYQPHDVYRIDAMPRTRTGKIAFAALKAMAEIDAPELKTVS